jgi:hypothetical protein
MRELAPVGPGTGRAWLGGHQCGDGEIPPVAWEVCDGATDGHSQFGRTQRCRAVADVAVV